jgi:hypothetical protein
MRAAGLALLLLLVGSAEALDVGVEPYREARRAGALGAVAGRVAAEPRTLGGLTQPFVGTTVTLLPRSEALVSKLERLRDASRESSRAFAEAAPAMRRAQEAYERELLEVGAPDLTPLVLVDRDGSFMIDDVPAGAWVLIAWHGVQVDVSASKPRSQPRNPDQPDVSAPKPKSGSPKPNQPDMSAPKSKSRPRNPYQPRPRLQGYQTVTVWLQTLTVAGGATATVELTDRNGWFRGVIEERVLDTGR